MRNTIKQPSNGLRIKGTVSGEMVTYFRILGENGVTYKSEVAPYEIPLKVGTNVTFHPGVGNTARRIAIVKDEVKQCEG